jgi:hypothetical protein
MLIEFLDLVSKDGQNCGRGIANGQLGCQRMREKVDLCLCFVFLQSSIENRLKVGRGHGKPDYSYYGESGIVGGWVRGRQGNCLCDLM